jgi:hypothetical protein
MSSLARLLRAILLLILSPLILLAAVLALALTDLAWLLFGRKKGTGHRGLPAGCRQRRDSQLERPRPAGTILAVGRSRSGRPSR